MFVIISQWENDEVKCAFIKIKNKNAANDYEWTLNCKWKIFITTETIGWEIV